MNHLDRAGFKRLANSMSKAFRDSMGGGIVERFEAVSKLLFIKVVDERMVAGNWPGAPKAEQPALEWRSGDISRTVYERARQLWLKATEGPLAKGLQRDRGGFPEDVEAVARIVKLLQPHALDRVDVDIKGAAYEELLRDTFEKNDNQQYFTPRHLMDFTVGMADPSFDSIICDPASGSGGFLVGGLNYVADRYPDEIPPQVYGVDIDARMAWVARINVFLHGGDPANVFHLPGAGSLKPLPQIQKVLPRGGFTTILTNPPFGSDMTDTAALDGFRTGRGRPTRRRGVLFIERCLELLKPGGTLAVIIDDSILNLDGNADIRELLRKKSIIRAVISLPDVAFMPYSTAKSSVVLVTKKDGDTYQKPVFMADVEHVGNRPNGDPLYQEVPSVDGVRPLLSDLPAVLAAWNHYKELDALPVDADQDKVFLADIDAYLGQPSGDRLDVNFFHPTRAHAAATLARASSPTYALSELYDFHTSGVNASDLHGDSIVNWIGLGEITAETGEYEVLQVPGERIRSAVRVYQGGDVLVSKLRPKLRKVIRVPEEDDGGICSAEILVLRQKETPAAPVIDDYVAYLLRSDLGYGQQVYQVTGVGRPRVSPTALKQLRVPVPPLHEQRLILRELDAAFAHYRELHQQADALRQQAQQLLHAAYASSVDAVTSGEGMSDVATPAAVRVALSA
ncbi:hypothetical protein GCM10009860_03220 [Microbacterium mitrae]|uniref:N-6 DNA methylase n=1 Tax=Microbacterium mitrae TaxID=664640 RepID=A0A5C8HNQ8_9MICO|nr:N-6 DNA methylase [Microbacterium mitrae]TXK05726.1 N-6 DNA methylase [Microbacterium mitrae]